MIKKSSAIKTKLIKVKSVPVERKIKRGGGKLFLKLILFIIILFLLYFFRSVFVAAFVGWRPITRYQLVKTLEKKYGSQILEQLVSENIINNEVKIKGIKVTKSDIDAEINKIRSVVESQGSTLEAELTTYGQSMNELEENVLMQKKVEQLLGSAIDVSEKEAQEYFDKNKTTFAANAKFEDVKTDLINSLKQQKVGVEFEKWMTEKKGSSKVIYFLNFK